jgi:hypothetical protein
MMQYKIMLTGPSGSGKDTMAQAIKDAIPNCHAVAFADELKRASSWIVQGILERESMIANEFDPNSEAGRKIMRPLWQWLGTDFVRNVIDKKYWINAVDATIRSKNHLWIDHVPPSFIVTDCRFNNEHQWGIANGFVIVRVDRKLRTPAGIPGHVSELEHEDIEEDLCYKNKGTIENMREWVASSLLPYCAGLERFHV